MAEVSIDTVLRLQDFGLERLDEDRAIVGFAEKAANPEPSTSTTATVVLLSALAPDRAALRWFSRRGIRISHESL